jgi:hypothetical protein
MVISEGGFRTTTHSYLPCLAKPKTPQKTVLFAPAGSPISPTRRIGYIQSPPKPPETAMSWQFQGL